MAQEITAVEWFAREINKINVSTEARLFIEKLKNRAKDMEKEQILDAYIEASPKLEDIIKESAEQYYNKTYKPQNT